MRVRKMVSVHHPDSANRRPREGGNGGISQMGFSFPELLSWGKFCFVFLQKNASSRKLERAVSERREKA